MEKRTSIIKGSILAGALLAVSGFSANATTLVNYRNLGNGEAVRTNLLSQNGFSRNFELKCGASHKTDSTSTAKKGKDGKCGEGKCGASKKSKN